MTPLEEGKALLKEQLRKQPRLQFIFASDRIWTFPIIESLIEADYLDIPRRITNQKKENGSRFVVYRIIDKMKEELI